MGVFVTCGCSVSSDTDVPVEEFQNKQRTVENGKGGAASGLRLALLRPSDATDMAALQGVLRLDGECLYVGGSEDSDSRTLPAFSFANVKWDTGTKTLVAHGKRIAIGQKVLLTGSTAVDRNMLRWVQKPNDSCSFSDIFITGAIEPRSD